MGVEFLSQEALEAKAWSVLEEYRRRFGSAEWPVVPVDEILECLFGLTLRFGEVKKQWGSAVQGATILADKAVWVDDSLEPEAHPDQEGAYRFTLAHEIGHWVLHRDVAGRPDVRLAHTQPAIPPPTWGSARKTACDRIEHQANRFAGALLMPAPWLRDCWRAATGGDAPQDMTSELDALKENNEFGPEWEPAVAVSKTLAPVFRVSNFAMQIRLKRVGLLTTAEKSATAP